VTEDSPRTTQHAGDPLAREALLESSTTSLGATAEDRRIIAALVAGDEATFRRLVARHHGALVRVAMAFVPSRAVAEEVAQETWTAVVGGLASFEGRSTLKTWIFRILTNRAKTRGAREGRSVPLSAFDTGEDETVGAVRAERFSPNGMWAAPPRRWESDTPEKLAMQRQALERLGTALKELPPGQRAVVTLRDVEGFASDEVCSILEISETNQRVLLHRGRSKLRRTLEEYLDGT